jgi:hypothetical protein
VLNASASVDAAATSSREGAAPASPPPQRADPGVGRYHVPKDHLFVAALVLGVSSMCNHAHEPNAYLWLFPDQLTAELWSIRAIGAGEEVTVSYRAEGDHEPLWFDVVEDP